MIASTTRPTLRSMQLLVKLFLLLSSFDKRLMPLTAQRRCFFSECYEALDPSASSPRLSDIQLTEEFNKAQRNL